MSHDHLSRQEGSGMTPIDLHAVAERFHRALEAKPSKGPITEKGIAAITDSVADVPELLAEVSGIRARWDEVSEDESWWIGGAWGDYGEVVVPLRVLTYILDGELDQTPQDIEPGFATRYADQVARAEAAEADLTDAIERVRDELAEHPGTAWDSAIKLRDRVLAALEANDTGVTPDGSGLPSDERNRFSDDETGSRA